MATAATVTIRLDGDSATLIRELNKANAATRSSFGAMQKNAASAAKGFAVIGAAAAAGFAILVKRSFDTVDALVKARDQVGATTTALAGLKLAGLQAGVGFESIVSGTLKMQRSLVEAATKGGDLARAYENIGLSARDLLTKSPDQQIAQIADAFGRIQNPAERTALAMQLFGKGGAEMIPLLKGGSAEMAKWAEQAQKLGLAISDIDAEKIDAAGDAVATAGAALEGVATQFAIAFAPSIQAAAQAFTDFVAGANAFRGVVGVIAETFGGVGKAIGESRVAAELLGAVGTIALTALVNAGNLLRLAVLGIDIAFASIQARFQELQGAKPFDDIGSKAKTAYANVEALRKEIGFLEKTNIGGVADAKLAILNQRLVDAETNLKSLGAAGELVPLARQLEKLKDQRSGLGGKLIDEKGIASARAEITAFQKQAAVARAVLANPGDGGKWIDRVRDSGLKGVVTLKELGAAVVDLQAKISDRKEFLSLAQFGDPATLAQIKTLDTAIGQVQKRISDGGGDILINVPTAAPRSEYGKLIDYIADRRKEIDAIPLVVSPGDVLADAKRIGDEAAAAFAAAAESSNSTKPPTLTVGVKAPPARLNFSELLDGFARAAEREQDLARQSAAEIQRIAVTGQLSITDSLVKIAEERAQALTDVEAQAAAQQAAASGVVDTFEREKALAKNRIKLAEDLAGSILAARQSVVEAGWAIKIDLSDNTGPPLIALREQLRALQSQRINVVANVDTAQAQAQLVDLDARIQQTKAALAKGGAGAVFSIDYAGAISAIETVNARRAELAIASNEEIRRIAVSGEKQISQELQSVLAAMAQNLTAIQRQQAELQAATTGKPVVFDDRAALYENQIQLANDAADALVAARARVAEGGPLALPSQDPTTIRANTAAAAQAMLDAYNESSAAQIEADSLVSQTLFLSKETAGQALIELAARQAREKVLAEFEARGQALSETGQFSDPATQAAFETAVQDETLTREKGFLDKRLQLQDGFNSRYGQLQTAITLFTGKTWANSNKKTLSNLTTFAGSALDIAGSLFQDSKPIAIAQAIVSTLAGAAKALELPYPENLAAMASTLAAGFAQVQAIRSTNVGGGSAGGGVGGGAFTAPSGPTEAESRNLGNPDRQNAIQVIFNGDVNGWDSYIQTKVVEGLREAVDQRDVVIFGPDSRQARELQRP